MKTKQMVEMMRALDRACGRIATLRGNGGASDDTDIAIEQVRSVASELEAEVLSRYDAAVVAAKKAVA